jgi:hypothetical protein
MGSELVLKSWLIAIAARRGQQRTPLDLSRGSHISLVMHRIELQFNTFPQKEPFTIVNQYRMVSELVLNLWLIAIAARRGQQDNVGVEWFRN